jgi:TP901 family phage tail tape measure protein
MASQSLSFAFYGVDRSVSSTLQKMQGEFNKTWARSQTMGDKFAAVGGAMSSVGQKMSIGVTLPLAAIGAKSVTVAAEFGKNMNLLAAMTGTPKKQMDGLSKLALQMGKDTVFSANDAAAAMLELAKGGMTAAQIKAGALKGTMTLAAAGNLQLADAATYASNAMNMFGLKAKDVPAIADALAGAANASTASVESLGLGLAQVGPGARNLGFTLNDTVGALAAFDQAGIKGSDAGTSLKTMMQRLVPTTTATVNAFQDLGLLSWDAAKGQTYLASQGIHVAATTDAVSHAMAKYVEKLGAGKEGTATNDKAMWKLAQSTGAVHNQFFKANGSIKSMSDVAGILSSKLKVMDPLQRQTTLNTLFGSDAQRAAGVLMNDGAAGIQKFVDATKKQGSAQNLANAGMKGLAGSLEQLKGSVETAELALGSALAPTVQKVAGLLKLMADAFTSLPKSTQTAIVTVGLFVAAVGPAAFVVGHLMQNVKLLGVAYTVLTTASMRAALASKAQTIAIVAMYGVEKVVAVATKAWAAAQWVLNAALAANPIGIVVVGLVALGVALVLAYKHSETFRNIVQGSFRVVKAVATDLLNFFKGHWAVIVPLMTGPVGLAAVLVIKNWARIRSTVTATVGGIISFVRSHWALIVPLVLGPLGVVAVLVAKHWNTVRTITVAAWNVIRSVVSVGIAVVRAVVVAGMAVVRAVWNAGWTSVRATLSYFWNSIRGVVVLGVTIVKAVITAGLTVINAVWQRIWRVIGGFTLRTWAVLRSTITVGVNVTKAVISAGLNFINSVWQRIWGIIRTVTSAVWSAMKSQVLRDITWVRNLISTVTTAISGTWGRFFGYLSKTASSIWKTITGVFSNATSTLHKAVDGLVHFVSARWAQLTKALATPIRWVIKYPVNYMIGAINTIGGKVGLPHIPNAGNFASGGLVRGPGGPRDDRVRANLSNGEFVVNAKATARNRAMLEKINANTAQYHPIRNANAQGQEIGAGKGGASGGRAGADSGVWRNMWAYIHKVFPTQHLHSAFRPGSVVHGSGNQSMHATGHAIDIDTSVQTFNYIKSKFGSSIHELIMSQMNGAQVYRGQNHMYGEPTRGDHFNHIHWGMDSFGAGGQGSGIGNPITGAGNVASYVWKKFRAGLAGLFNLTVRKPVQGLINRIPGIKGMGDWIPKTAGWPLDKAYKWLAGGADKKAAAEAAQNASAGAGLGGGMFAGLQAQGGSNRAIGRSLLAQTPWASQWNALNTLWTHESNWNNNAQNPTSTAYGIAQFLNGTWAGTGYRKTSDPKTQILAGLEYIGARYGSPNAAWDYWAQHHSYKAGTPYVPQDGPAMLHRGEAIIPAKHNKGSSRGGDIYLTVDLRDSIGHDETAIASKVTHALETAKRRGARSVVMGW